MLTSGMRVFAWAIVLFALGCRAAPHIDLSLRNDHCETYAGNPPPASGCAAMSLTCANFVEARVYESDSAGSLGRILGSNCLSTAELGAPADLCALQMSRAPFSLFKDLPDGKTVRFRMRALYTNDVTTACNVDLPDKPAPTLVFDGFSPPLALDGNDHLVVIEIGVCGSCDIVGVSGYPCELPNPPPVCLAPYDHCDNGSPAFFVPGGCCGICTLI